MVMTNMVTTWPAQEWMMNRGGFLSASSRSSPPHFSTQNVGASPPPPPLRPLASKAEMDGVTLT